jgi:glycosyltransferase involved in cell wall biosynthesis
MDMNPPELLKNKKVLILIPAYNEEERIGKVIKQAGKHLPVLVVDDGSVDQTSRLAEELGAIVLTQQPNQGKGAALMRGFAFAVEQGYDAVITLDADGQHDPDEIPLFLESFLSGGDLVIGKRDFRKMPFPRNISNTVGTWSFSSALGRECPDNQSGYRLHSRRLIEAALDSSETNFEFEVEIIVRCILKGYQLAWVPIKTIYAGENSHVKPLKHIWHFYRIVRKTRQLIHQSRNSVKNS